MAGEQALRAGSSAIATAVVAVPDGWAETVGIQPAAELGHRTVVRTYDAPDLDFPTPWADVEALVPGDHQVDAATMERMPALRIISVDGTGVWDRIDVAAATARGIAVCNVRDYAVDAVAEFTIGTIVTLGRHILAASQGVRQGRWNPDEFIGRELGDRTLGLVGFGGIGARVAELARAFGMHVLCATAHPERHRSASGHVEFVSLSELLGRCDVLSVHAALSDDTRGLIGAAELSRLRPGALLVNTARAGLVDQAALLDALRSGRLAGAALDVTDPEPLPPSSPLLGLDTVLVTPHIAASTYTARRRAVLGCLSNIAAFLGGEPTSVVNPEALSPR
jgi:phosphoglycerate dehydrogenase-like enzyme